MDVLAALWIVSVAFTGFTEGHGVLPNELTEAVGRTVTFTTDLTPTEQRFEVVSWTLTGGGRDLIIITSTNGANNTAPAYEGRITLFRSTGSLEVRNLAQSDSGTYRLSIVTATANTIQGSTELSVLVPVSSVVINVISTDLVEFNSSARLSCSSSGSSLSFRWLNLSSEVTAADRVQITDGGAALSITNVTRYDQGPFRCHVSNAVSEGTSDPQNLIISFGPDAAHLEVSPLQEHYEKGSDVSFTCSASSSPAARFYWYMNGQLMTDTGAHLSLTDIQESQTGNYTCQAFNSKTLRYQTSRPAPLAVYERISAASVTSSTDSLIEGSTVNLTCDAAGSVLTRGWMKNGSPLNLADNMTLHDHNRVLSFYTLRRSDSGEYSCKVGNPINSDKAKYNMIVVYGPDSVEINGPNAIQVKQPLRLTCSAASTPSASYTWILNGTVIHATETFIKDPTELSDAGKYICEAKNNVTGRTASDEHLLSVIEKKTTCPAGCIAGIVIACLVVFGGAGGGAYYVYRRKRRSSRFSDRKTSVRTGGDRPDNAAFSGSQELNYADVRVFQKKGGERVQLGLQNNSEYAEVRQKHCPAAASSPPTYDAHIQRMKKQAPPAPAQPGMTGEQTYAQVRTH